MIRNLGYALAFRLSSIMFCQFGGLLRCRALFAIIMIGRFYKVISTIDLRLVWHHNTSELIDFNSSACGLQQAQSERRVLVY